MKIDSTFADVTLIADAYSWVDVRWETTLL